MFLTRMTQLLLALALSVPAAAADLVFQGRDATVVVKPDPEVGDAPADEIALVVLMRKGEPPRAFRAADLLEPGELRIDAGRVRWLAARGSKLVKRGAQLKLESGRTLLVPFDGNLNGHKVRVAVPQCPCSFTDEAGTLHVVDSANDVPQRLWAAARPLDGADVQVMPMPPPPPRDPEPAEPAPPRRRVHAESAPAHRTAPPPPREDYYEYIRRITGQRGPQDRLECRGNDGKPTSCDWLYEQ